MFYTSDRRLLFDCISVTKIAKMLVSMHRSKN